MGTFCKASCSFLLSFKQIFRFIVITLYFNPVNYWKQHFGSETTLLSSPNLGDVAHESMLSLVTKHGYQLEDYRVVTGDGYILRLYRIPPSNATRPHTTRSNSKLPVLLQHGLLDSSVTWVTSGLENSLAFVLADEGYDVWLSNSRGNSLSRHHKTIPTKKDAFWDFSFSEMARNDLPAIIDAILDTTRAPRIHYVGHSQGGAIFLAAASEQSTVARKVQSAALLAPASYLSTVEAPAVQLLADPDLLGAMELVSGEFLPGVDVESSIFYQICKQTPEDCANLLSLICGYNGEALPPHVFQYHLQFTPAGTSTRNMVHWAQLVESNNGTVLQASLKNTLSQVKASDAQIKSRASQIKASASQIGNSHQNPAGRAMGRALRAFPRMWGTRQGRAARYAGVNHEPTASSTGDAPVFRMFDYGDTCRWLLWPRECNFFRYGTEQPPVWNLSHVDVPMVLFAGGADTLVSVEDVAYTARVVKRGELRVVDDYAHLDFVWSVTARGEVYDELLQWLEGGGQGGGKGEGGQGGERGAGGARGDVGGQQATKFSTEGRVEGEWR